MTRDEWYRSKIPPTPLQERRATGNRLLDSVNRYVARNGSIDGDMLDNRSVTYDNLSNMPKPDYASGNKFFADRAEAISNRYTAENELFMNSTSKINDKYAKGNDMFRKDVELVGSGTSTYDAKKYNALEGIGRIMSMIRR